jgi:ribosomal protein S18 acetylase RimI-like enzyme
MRSFDLYWIAVHPSGQGRGCGRSLLKAAEQLMAAKGASRIYVETSSRPQYEPTRRFYKACGYREEAFLEDFYAPQDGKIIFVKALCTTCATGSPAFASGISPSTASPPERVP